MNRTPYVGITGFVHEVDLVTARECQREIPAGHLFMAGVLVSHKTLSGLPTANRRYPTLAQAQHLVRSLHAMGCWTVAHYNTSGCTDPLSEQLGRVVSLLGPNVGGIQMNVVKPNVDEVRRFRHDHPTVRLILQVNGSSLSNRLPATVMEYVRTYRGLVDYALLDMSGGRGRKVDPKWAAGVLDLWATDTDPLPGIAGGLGPDSGPILLELAAATRIRLSALSYDAEGRIRVPVTDPDPHAGKSPQDTLDHHLAIRYMKAIRWAAQ